MPTRGTVRAPRKLPGIENRPWTRDDGTVTWRFRVRWTDPATGRRESHEFDRQPDAVDFQATLRLARRAGTLGDLTAGRETVAALTADWWDAYAQRNLERATLINYMGAWNRHAHPRVGHLETRQLTPGVISRLRDDLERDGVGAPTVRMTLAMLQSMLRWAVEQDRVKANPVKQVRKPRAPRQRAVQPLAPATVESLRAELAPYDAALCSVIAYAGLRPEEALALQARHVGRDTLLVEQKAVDGRIVIGQKTRRPPRTVGLLQPLRVDLRDHMLAIGRPDGTDLLFPGHDGGVWTASAYRNWRRRIFQPAAHRAGLGILDRSDSYVRQPDGSRKRQVRATYEGARPYDLRHSFASLLIHAGDLSVVEIAGQLGHSTEMLLRTYAHVLDELKGQPKVSAAVAIMQARAARRKEQTG